MKKQSKHRKQRPLTALLAVLTSLSLLLTGVSGSVPEKRSGQSASAADEWENLTGWVDYSASGNLSFQNLNDGASQAKWKNTFDGSEGFHLRYRIDFPEHDVQSVSRVSISSDSRYNYFFDIRVTALGSKASLSVGFCCGGPWAAPVVTDTGMLDGADGAVYVCADHKAGSNDITFSLCALDGTVLYTKRASDRVYLGNAFLDGSDLRLYVSPVENGGIFRFSELTVTDYPDDGIDSPVTADSQWSLGSGWEDVSENGEIRIRGDAGDEPAWLRETFDANREWEMSFVLQPTAVKNEMYLTLYFPSLSSYVRFDLKYQDGQASESLSLNLGAEQGYAWKSLGGTPWNWTGDTYRVRLHWQPDAKKLTLSREAVDNGGNTIAMSANLSLPLLTNDADSNYFAQKPDEKMSANICSLGSGGFTFSQFSVVTCMSGTDQWSMPEGWKDVSSVSQIAIQSGMNVSADNMLNDKINPLAGFDLSFDVSFGYDSIAELILTNTGYPEKQLTLSMRGTLSTAVLSLLYQNGDTQQTLAQSENVVFSRLRLTRLAGSNTMTVSAESADGTPVWQATTPAGSLCAANFLDVSPLSVSLHAESAGVTVSDLILNENRRTPAAQSEYDLASGWTAYPDDAGGLYFTKANGRENEMVLRQSLHGADGFRVQYDLTFCGSELIESYFKIGVLDGGERYFFSRVKSNHGQVYAEGQFYNLGVWSSNLLSANAGEKKQTEGTVHVCIERQQGSDALHYVLALPDGTILSDETVRFDAMDNSVLNNTNIRFMIGRDSGIGSFIVRNVTVETYPVIPVALTTLSVDGDSTARAGQSLTFRAVTSPENTTVRSFLWKLNGAEVSENRTLTYLFETAGDYELVLTACDFSGNEKTVRKTVHIDPQPAGIGDVDLDGDIDAEDAACILRYLTGQQTLTAEQQGYADVNRDKTISSADAQELLSAGTVPAEKTASAAQEKKAPETKNGSLSVREIAAPEYLEYLWNGTFANDRPGFSVLLPDWLLGTSDTVPAEITAGSPGKGISYTRAMGDWWTAKGKITFAQNSSGNGAQITLTGGENALSLKLLYADLLTVTLLAGSETLYTGTLPATEKELIWIFDNTRDGEELRLHLTAGDGSAIHIALTGLPAQAKTVLAETDGLEFTTFGAASAVKFTEFCIDDLKNPFESDAQMLAYLENETARVMSLNKMQTTDGRWVSTCDISQNYNALWLRDPMLMAMYAPEYYPLDIMQNDLDFTLEHVRESDGWVPDHVGFNGRIGMSAGDFDQQIAPAQLDPNMLVAIQMDCIMEKMQQEDPEHAQAYFEKWEAAILRALAAEPLSENGLVYNDPAIQYSTFGLIDAIAPNGECLEVSTLYWYANTKIAEWQEFFGKDSSLCRTRAKRIEAALERTFYDETTGLLRAATGNNRQPDLLGTTLTVSLGFPLSERAKKSIADYLYLHYDEVTQYGALRHLPGGAYWEKTITLVPKDEYMNGAYWPVFTGWLIDSIKDYYPALAKRTIERHIIYGYQVGFYECRNGGNRKLLDYVNSINNAIPQARELLSNPLQSVSVIGTEQTFTGCTENYTLAIQPQDAVLRSVVWELDGEIIGSEETLNCRFGTADTYLLTVRVTDVAGNVLTDQISVTVTDPAPVSGKISCPAITGKVGDTVTIPFTFEGQSGLSCFDLALGYDPARLEVLAVGSGDSRYAEKGALWTDGLLASGTASPGTILVAAASADNAGTDGVLFSVQFRLLQDAPSALNVTIGDSRAISEELQINTRAELTVSGATEDTPALCINSAFLRIDENINVIYAAEVPAGYTDPYMIFRYHDRDITVRDYTVDENGRYCFEFTRVMPQCLGDNICATLYAKRSGKTVSDTVETYSIRAYCESRLAKTDDAKLIALLSDLLTYGAAAQTYTGYKTDALVTSGLDLTPSAFAAIEAKRATFIGEKSEAADWYSATLGLANDLSMRFTFTAASVDGLSVDVTIGGRTQTFTKFESLGDGRYAVMFRGIKATEFDDDVTAVLKQNGTPVGRTVNYSVNTYISSTQDCDHAGLAALVQALYNYGASAEDYAAK